MSAVFGIHLGNTSACLALFKEGRIDVIANDSGDRVTPAVVAFNESETVVGLSAKLSLHRNSLSTVIHNKKLMNEKIEDAELESLIRSSVYKIIRESEPIKYELKRGDKNCHFTPEDVAATIFKKMFSIASSSVRTESELQAVLCVPQHFTQPSRQAVARAAEEAGFEVLQVIGEPAAAVLAYGVGQAEPQEFNGYVLVYRLGGVTLDVSVIHVNSGMFTVVDTIHVHDLGGDKLTAVLANYLAGEFRQKWKLDPKESRRSMSKLTAAAETVKHVLSTMSTAHCFVESLCDGVDFSHQMSRARFENLLSAVVQDYVAPIEEVLTRSGLKRTNVSHVILCGGSMKIPKLQQTLTALFPHAEVQTGHSPDEAIAIGAAKHGSFLPRPFDPDCQYLAHEVPALTNALHIKVGAATTSEPIVMAATPMPCQRQRKCEAPAGGGEVVVELLEVSAETTRLLGSATLTEIETPAKLSVDVSLTSVGDVTMVVTDLKSLKKATWKCEGTAPEKDQDQEENASKPAAS